MSDEDILLIDDAEIMFVKSSPELRIKCYTEFPDEMSTIVLIFRRL